MTSRNANIMNININIKYDTFRKRGKGWEYLGERYAKSPRSAALFTSYIHNIKVVGIRLADTNLKLTVYRFQYVAAVHHG